jgi:hypothetical protein
MTTVQDLLDAGNAVALDEFTVELAPKIAVRKVAIESGGIEDFAAMFGWTPTIIVNGVEVPNPKSAYEKCREVIADFTRQIFVAIITNKVNATAEAQKAAILAQLL